MHHQYFLYTFDDSLFFTAWSSVEDELSEDSDGVAGIRLVTSVHTLASLRIWKGSIHEDRVFFSGIMGNDLE